MIMLLVWLALIGLAAFLLLKIPMPQPMQTVIICVAVIGGILLALNAFNVTMPSPSVPRIK